MIWLWCEWEKDWRRGCGKIRGGSSRCVKGRGDGVRWARPGNESLRGRQQSGLDLYRSNNFIKMGGEDDQGRPYPCGTYHKQQFRT